jgi:hypothetical protein
MVNIVKETLAGRLCILERNPNPAIGRLRRRRLYIWRQVGGISSGKHMYQTEFVIVASNVYDSKTF